VSAFRLSSGCAVSVRLRLGSLSVLTGRGRRRHAGAARPDRPDLYNGGRPAPSGSLATHPDSGRRDNRLGADGYEHPASYWAAPPDSGDNPDLDDVHRCRLIIDFVQDPGYRLSATGIRLWHPTRPRSLGRADQPVRQSRDVSGRTGPYPRCGRGRGYEAPSAGKRRSGSRQGFCIDPVERSIQSIEADPAAPGGLVRQMRRQRRAIFEVSEVVDADQRSDWLAVLADGDGAVALPGLGDELTQARLRPRRGPGARSLHRNPRRSLLLRSPGHRVVSLKARRLVAPLPHFSTQLMRVRQPAARPPVLRLVTS